MNHPLVITRQTKGRRISLRVDGLGRLNISAPRWASQSEIDALLKNNRHWIQDQMQSITSSYSVLGGTRLIETVPIKHIYADKLGSKVVNEALQLIHPEDFNDWPVLYELSRNHIRKLFKQREPALSNRFWLATQKHNLKPKSLTLKWMRSRWGSCSRQGNINLNLQLLRLDSKFQDYVIAHELAHLEHPHHQAGFKKGLSQLYPEAQSVSKQLRSYRLWY